MKLHVTKNDKLVIVIKTYNVNIQYKKLLTITKINNIITECKKITSVDKWSTKLSKIAYSDFQ